MFCTNCGKQIADGARFCTGCGKALEVPAPAPAPVFEAPAVAEEVTSVPLAEEAAPVEAVAEEAPVVEEAVPVAPVEVSPEAPAPAPVFEAPAPAPVFEAPAPAAPESVLRVKKMGSSALFLIGTIITTVLAIGNALTSFGSGSVGDYLGYYRLSEIGEFLSAISVISTVSSVIGFIPVILLVIGLWVTFGQSLNKQSPSTSGWTLVKSSMIVRLVFKFLGLALAVVGFALVISTIDSAGGYLAYTLGGYAGSGMDVVKTYVIVIFSSIFVCLALPITYDFFVVSTVNKLKKTVATAEVKTSGMGGMIALNYVFVALNAISVLLLLAVNAIIDAVMDLVVAEASVLTDLAYMPSIEIGVWPIISGLLTITSLVLFSINLSAYKKSCKA